MHVIIFIISSINEMMIIIWSTVLYGMCTLIWHNGIIVYQPTYSIQCKHDDIVKSKHFPRHWPFVREIRRPSQRPVTRSFAVFFDLRLNKRLNKQSRRHCAHYDVNVTMWFFDIISTTWKLENWTIIAMENGSLYFRCLVIPDLLITGPL